MSFNMRRRWPGSLLPAAVRFLLYCAILATPRRITPAPRNPSAEPQITQSEEGKREEAERQAARAQAHHFDRVLTIALENADYERAIQDPSLRDLAIEGASLTNFHALFHPSYPNYWR